MPNAIAFAALFVAPVIAFMLFKRYQPVLAAALTMVLGYLFLPEETGIDLPVLPEYNKQSVTVGAVFLFASLAISKWKTQSARRSRGLIHSGQQEPLHVLPGWLPRNPVVKFLFLAMIPAALVTTFTNTEPVVLGSGVVLPGYDLYSSLSFVMTTMVAVLPFLIGRRLFAHPEGQKTLLTVLALSAFAYSALVLVELRLSPQLHRWVYGFHPFSFAQAMRGGNFRPSVFTNHGLWLAIFNVIAILAAIGAYRARAKAVSPKMWVFVGTWLFLIVAVSNSLGAFLLLLLVLPVALFAPTRAQILTASIVGVLILSFPVMRERGLIPTDDIVAIAESANPDRAQSLNFRFENEDQFLARVGEKPLAGWGMFGRNFVYNEFTGERTTIIDGYWIIVFSTGGYLQYLLVYGLLTVAFFQLLFRSKADAIGPETAALTLILTVNLLDMVPNGTLTVITWIVAGAVVGRIEVLRESGKTAGAAEAGPIRGGRMRHRGMQGAVAPVTRAGKPVHGSTRLQEEGARKDANSRLDPLENEVPNQRGDQYSRYRQVHSRALREDTPKPRQNFRKK